MVLSSSVRTRSTVMRSISPVISAIARNTRGASVNPSWETNRQARSMRNGSSAKDCSGAAGVSRTPTSRASIPFRGSTNSWRPSGCRRTAMALTVKSRRIRSPSRVSPKTTSGFRVTPSYESARNVVISICCSIPPPSRLTAESVPNSIPVSHTASA